VTGGGAVVKGSSRADQRVLLDEEGVDRLGEVLAGDPQALLYVRVAPKALERRLVDEAHRDDGVPATGWARLRGHVEGVLDDTRKRADDIRMLALPALEASGSRKVAPQADETDALDHALPR
jgi:hypothetical protein